MKIPAVKDSTIQQPAKFVLLLLIAAVPLAVTTITYNQSDLPKNAVLIIIASLFCILAAYGMFTGLISKQSNGESAKISFVPQLDIPAVLMLFAAVLSTVFSINSYISYYGQYERQIGLITYIYFFLIYCCSAFVIDKENFSSKLLLTMELTAAAVSIYAILQQFGIDPLGVQPASDTRPVTPIGNAVFAGGFLAIVLPLSALNISGKKNIVLKLIIPAIILAGIVVTRTRSAYIAVFAELIAALVIFILIRGKVSLGKGNLKKIITFAGLGILLILIFAIAFPENIFIQRLMSIFKGTDNPRWMIWRDAFGIIGKYPLTGPGIGTFSNAFAEFYSYELRYQDVMRYVDNAHNNYLQILFTMGAVGLGCYLLLLVSALRICFKNLSLKAGNSSLYFAAIFISLAGYSAYGLTNFDELTIMLYFTILLVLIRAGMPGKKIIEVKRNLFNKFAVGAASFVISAFVIINSIDAVNIFFADIHFLKGEKLMLSSDLKGGVNEMNTAIIMQPGNPAYRYLLAENVYSFLSANKKINESAKNDLLRQAANEVIKARQNHSNVNDCDGLLSLIYFESGKTGEAEELKRKVLEGDAVNIFYRINLAYSYINHKDLNLAKEQIDAVDKIGYRGINFWFIAALYNYNAGNKEEALRYCNLILEKDPVNPDALGLQKLVMQMH